ncbi:hypothetical protein B0H17DRAFT_1149559 [Mycena rosella]|uniref:Secreted protein n=1 Tax=Mycena rosella TaxID=1033263 RepID=A0AAD7FPE8_MYCRO|nr:hypothetical protein B0H17DRAFT_1149559 [Mycena rosella]
MFRGWLFSWLAGVSWQSLCLVRKTVQNDGEQVGKYLGTLLRGPRVCSKFLIGLGIRGTESILELRKEQDEHGPVCSSRMSTWGLILELMVVTTARTVRYYLFHCQGPFDGEDVGERDEKGDVEHEVEKVGSYGNGTK